PAQEKPGSNYRPNNNKKTFTKDMVFEKAAAEESRLSKNKFNAKPGKGKNAKNQKKEVKVTMPPVTPKKITIGETVVLGELAKTMGKTAGEVIKKLFTMGIMATINQELDADTAILLADEFGVTVEVKADRAAEIMEDIVDNEAEMIERPPVVTIMGHVDHGKTSLLDAIRHTNVVSGEAGGITQHIGAYQVEINGKKITFLDTPGHEAFTAMRARGAQMTDIAVIVVAADDGVMPQTIEAINHSKAAGVPIIIAINKMDKPSANPDRVKQELTEYGLVGEEWGGDTIMVPVSAKARQNIEGLLEMILLVAEVGELKANPNRQARGAIVEAKLDKNRGPVATLLVQKGTLNAGDNILAGAVFGKVRAMHDDKGRKVRTAGPSTPVEVLGFSEVPPAGEIFMVVKDERDARLVAAKQQAKKREEELHKSSRVSLDDLFKQIEEGDIKDLNIVVKADVQGSVEALTQSLLKLSTGEVRVNVIHSGVGGVSESDVMLAAASNAIIIGFNVIAPPAARAAAEAEKLDIRLYRVIYDCLEDVKKAMSGLLAPEYREQIVGNVEVRTTFKVPKVGTIAGCYVTNGKINRNAQVRVIRDNVVIAEDKISSLKRFKDDAKEVVQGYECGIGLENFNDLKEGDVFEVFVMEEIAREL
ncbi:MAG: translation initiation factor IF-2, partial [Bacillota bacterium]|nr:translation initiation factor IF-2 [Bacillota bacterium]